MTTGRLTMWGAGQIMKTFFSRSAEAPSSFYLALICSVPPNAYLSGAELDEPSAAEYARVEIPNTLSYWADAGQLQIMVTDQDVTSVTPLEDWGVVRYWALCNAPVDGYVYLVGDLASPIAVVTGDPVIVSAGDLGVSLGPFYVSETS